MFRIALRGHIGGVLGWGGFMSLFAVIEAGSFSRLASQSPNGRDELAVGLQGMAQQVTYLLPLPTHLNTLGGYTGWFLFGYLPLMFGIWAVIAGTGASRGDEERGLVDQWLATGVPRWRFIVARMVAFAVAVAAAIAMPTAIVGGIAYATSEPLNYQGLWLEGIPALLTSLVCFGTGLLAGQVVSTRRNAMGAAMIVVVGLNLLNGFSRETTQLRTYRWVSPFAYTDRSNPIVAQGHLVLGDMAVILGFALAVTILATWAFSKRDLGSTIFGQGRGEHHRQLAPDANPILRVPVLLNLWEQRLGIFTWSVAIGLYAASNLSIIRPMADFFRSQGQQSMIAVQAQTAYGMSDAHPYTGLIAGEWFQAVCLLLAAFAITQVARWASDDGEGRLEMTLSAPVPRWRVVADRAASVVLASTVLIAADAASVYVSANKQQFDLDFGPLITASLMVLPLGVAFAGVGAAVAAVRPRIAMFSLAGVLVLSFMLPLMAAPLFAPHIPPNWFLDLSVFKLYGRPLVDGPNWPGFWALMAIVVIGFGSAVVAMQRREVGR